MIYYLDTSVIVATLVKEVHTGRTQQWLSEQTPKSLTISDWVTTEFSSAVAVKLRTEQISVEQRAKAFAGFARLVGNFVSVLPISTSQFKAAAHFADHHELGIRAGDALHLAVAAETGATLCTLDKKLSKAGVLLGVKTQLL